MTPQELSVMKHLKGRTNKERLNSKQLCRLVTVDVGRPVSPSEIRGIIFDLRHHSEMAICSSREGYWEAQNKEEVLDIVRRLSNRVENQMKSIRGLTGYLENQTPQGQLF